MFFRFYPVLWIRKYLLWVRIRIRLFWIQVRILLPFQKDPDSFPGSDSKYLRLLHTNDLEDL
jgi:hypothetical protein